MYPNRHNLSSSQQAIQDKDQQTVRESYRLRITQAIMENWKANGAYWVDNCSNAIRGRYQPQKEYLINFSIVCICLRVLCFKFRVYDDRWPRVQLLFIFLSHSLYCSFNIKDWNRLPPLLLIDHRVHKALCRVSPLINWTKTSAWWEKIYQLLFDISHFNCPT